MAVRSVKAISIIGLSSSIEEVMTVCGKSQVFHPDDVSSFYSDTRNFIPFVDQNPYTSALGNFTDILTAAGIKPGIVDVDSFNKSDKELTALINTIINNLGGLLGRKAQLNRDIEQCNKSIVETSHFIGYELDMDKILACKFIKSSFGRLPKDSFQKLMKYDDNPYVAFFPCTSDESHYWGVYICPLEESREVDRIFSALYFENYKIEGLSGTPEEYFEKQKKRLAELKGKLEDLTADIEKYIQSIKNDINTYYTKLKELSLYHSIRQHARRYYKSFIIVGWVLSDDADEFVKKLESISSVECSLSDGVDEIKNSPPIKLKNSRFSKPFEFFIKLYGLPVYNEVDPTFFVAITYTLLFGIMFGDLGQGILVALIGAFMWKRKKMEIGRVLIPCGISSAVFGTVYGSVFGFEHLLDPLYHMLGFHEKPIEVMDSAVMLLIMAIIIGVSLVTIAMIINIYSSLKRHDIENGVFGASGIAGLVFYCSLIGGIAAQFVFNVKVMNLLYIIILIIVPLLAVFLKEPLSKLFEGNKNWKPEKWGEYCAQNFFELFETMLSYLSNTMSFLRVGAFVLIHSGMMLVVFILADMAGKMGIVPYALVLVFGNIFVMVLECLLVCIQVLRLEFYEMFSRFYIGGGREFKAISVENSEE